ncbi:MAG: DUF2809 domain-containing protein [Ignavibacteriales bacterium]
MLAFVALLIVEIIIAVFVNDAFIRPYVGDMLVVILMYTLIRGIVKKPIKGLPIYLFIFALTVEMAQYYSVLEKLNLPDNKIVSIIIGNTFDFKDILCYLFAVAILILWEKFLQRATRFQ